MELSLNLAWVALAGLMLGLWHRNAPRKGASRPVQMMALAMLLLLLFPVISVTDDLQAAQKPAEDDCYLRRDHVCSAPHCLTTMIADVPPPLFAGMPMGIVIGLAPHSVAAPSTNHPALSPIQNRPPPVA